MADRRSARTAVWVGVVLGVIAAAPARPAAQTIDENVRRLRAYHDRVVDVSKTLGARASLVDLIRPVIGLARERSASGQPVDENRSALMALTFYVNGWDLGLLVPESRDWPRPARRSVALRGRGDLAQHFIVSAFIAASGGSPLAAAAGLYKELRDARSGSGFSFSDLAADRAGEKFGLLAGTSDTSARLLQERVSAGLAEADTMPTVEGLADNLSEAEFTRRFGGVGGRAYNEVVSDIDRRVDALPLFQ